MSTIEDYISPRGDKEGYHDDIEIEEYTMDDIDVTMNSQQDFVPEIDITDEDLKDIEEFENSHEYSQQHIDLEDI